MAITVDSTVRSSMGQVLIDAIDAGSGAGKLRFYDGSRPATGGSATTLLAELTLSDPCATVSAGVVTFSTITSDASANATGTATWARIVTSAGTFVADFNVGTSGSDINMNTVSFVAGQQVSVTSATITVPGA